MSDRVIVWTSGTDAILGFFSPTDDTKAHLCAELGFFLVFFFFTKTDAVFLSFLSRCFALNPEANGSDLRWAVRSSSVMQAPRGDLSSGMLAVTRVLVLKRTFLTGCLQTRQNNIFSPLACTNARIYSNFRPLGNKEGKKTHLLCISHSFALILSSHTHTSPSPPPLTIFQSSACTAVTPRWCA